MDTPFIWVLSTTLAMWVRMSLESSTIGFHAQALRQGNREGRRASLSGQGGHGHDELVPNAGLDWQPGKLTAEFCVSCCTTSARQPACMLRPELENRA